MMKMIKVTIYTLFIFLLSSCGGDSNSTIPTVTTEEKDRLYISQSNGIDSEESGSKRQPYKSISYAINQNKGKEVIFLIEGGTYYSSITLSKGMELINSFENNISVVLKGMVELSGRNRLKSIIFNNGGLISKGEYNEIISCEFLKHKDYAISLKDNTSLFIQKTVIKDNYSTGIVAIKNSNLYLSEMNITHNRIGIQIKDNAKVTFSENEHEMNYITNNKKCNFLHSGKEDIELYNIKWNREPLDFFVERSCTNGADIVKIGIGEINYEGKIPKRGERSFTTNSSNQILFPSYGETISTTTPHIEYTNKERNYLAIAIFDKYPIISNNSIQNAKDIIWYWQSSLDDIYSIGSIIPYSRGFLYTSIINRNSYYYNFNHNLEPLKENSVYYIIVWEWDSKAQKVMSSSDISYFITSKEKI